MKIYLYLLICLSAIIVPLHAQNGNIDVAPAERYRIEGGSWNINGETGNVNIKLNKLTFNHGGTTGGIKLMIWASSQPYQPGTRGFTVAESSLGQLKSRQFYSNLSRNAKLIRPPVGTYYMTLMVLEWRNNTWTRQCHVTGNKTTTFR